MKHKNNIIKLCLGVFLALTMALPALAQKSVTFKGVVVDTTGEPIIGASVKVVGTTTGTITDLDGKFMVVVPSGKQVEISYIGYITQVLSDFKQTKIELKEDTQQLDEVVVVGYGTQKKAHLTGAIATVPMDDIQDLASGNLASTLSGMDLVLMVEMHDLVKMHGLIFVRTMYYQISEEQLQNHYTLLTGIFIQ
jgi:hypothetical protein